MPELPEVRTSAKLMNKDIKNNSIKNVIVKIPKMIKETTVSNFVKQLKGRKIIKVDNIAKFLVFHFDNDLIMLSHLRMEGKYRFSKELILGKHDHVIFELSTGFLIYADVRKFGTFELKNKNNYTTTNPIAKLGPYPIKSISELVHAKLKRKNIAIKSSLLDQTIVSGLGNIYVDEVLWKAKIHPETPSKNITLKQTENILEAADDILTKATEENGSSIRTYLAYNKIKGNYQNFLKVHTRVNEECPCCKTIIKKIKVNGRGTYICTQCQNSY